MRPWITSFVLIATVWSASARGDPPPLAADLGVEGLVAVLNERPPGDRSAELDRKRQACDRVTPALPDVGSIVPALVRLLGDPRAAPPAVAALVRLGPLAGAEVLAAGRSDDAVVRLNAARATAGLGRAAEPLLVDLSGNDPDPAVARAATYGLCAIRSPAASGPLVKLLATGTPEVRREALRAMDGWPLTSPAARQVAGLVAWAAVDPETAAAARVVVTRDKSRPLAVLRGLTAAIDGGGPSQAAALSVLAEYPRTTEGRTLIAARCVGSSDASARGQALRILHDSGAADLGPALYDLAVLAENRDRNLPELADVYAAATAELATATPGDTDRDRQTFDALVRILDAPDLSAGPRSAALAVARRYGPAEAGRTVPGAARLLGDARVGVDARVAAADVLVTVAPAGSAADTAATDAVRDGPTAVRVAAARYLAADPAVAAAAVPVLASARDPAARAAALQLSAAVPAPEAELLQTVARLTDDPDAGVRRLAWANLLNRTTGPAAPALRSALDTPAPRYIADPSVRAVADAVLTAVGLPAARSAPVPPTTPTSKPLPVGSVPAQSALAKSVPPRRLPPEPSPAKLLPPTPAARPAARAMSVRHLLAIAGAVVAAVFAIGGAVIGVIVVVANVLGRQAQRAGVAPANGEPSESPSRKP